MRPVGDYDLTSIAARTNGRAGAGLAGTVAVGAGAAGVAGALWWAWTRSAARRHGAPGWPGTKPHWGTAAKDGVGTALGPAGRAGSRVWFTLGQGALTEVFYPRADRPAIRGLSLIVTDGHSFVSDERHDADHQTSWVADGIPAYHLTNAGRLGRYRIEKTVLAHPRHDAVLQVIRLEPHAAGHRELRLFARLDPHLGDRGEHNTGWTGHYKGVPMLFAERDGDALALACSSGWRARSAGFAGSVSDGGRDLDVHGRLTACYRRAEDGNVILIGEVDPRGAGRPLVLALGFGGSPAEAAHHARAALLDDPEAIGEEYARGWREWRRHLPCPGRPHDAGGRDLTAISAAVLRIHEDKGVPGAFVASLSTPWGHDRDDGGTGRVGYHVAWPRDLVETAGGLLAAGAGDEALAALRYLRATQEADGHWPQNQWVDGTRVWDSIQMGETALPVLLVDLLARRGALAGAELGAYWPMVRAAAGYIVRSGPSSQEDRWEDSRGFTPFTLAALVSALLVAAEMAEAAGEPSAAAYLRESADAWNDDLEFWTYVEGTELARREGVRGYYLRIAPPDDRGLPDKRNGRLGIGYRPAGDRDQPASAVVSPDALAYVRFGLRAAGDPRIVDTVRVIDALLKVETPRGPSWRRYNHDGYGEKPDGSPFDDDQGVGRAWPLLTGERAHYELAAGRRDEALRLLHAMEAFAGDTGLIPEQVWDSGDLPARGLFLGRPTGSAMPLAWAHAEYLKLCRSLSDGDVFDRPPQTVRRYLVEKVKSRHVVWRPDHRRRAIPAGKVLRVELPQPATVRWGAGNVQEREDPTRGTAFGVHVADLDTAGLAPGCEVRFTLVGPAAGAGGPGNGPFVVRLA